MARAAARCFDSLRSCSSVRSSSCWIAPSDPTWYCIFCCRCLATAAQSTAKCPTFDRAARYSSLTFAPKEAVGSMEAVERIADALVRAVDLRDAYTGGHSESVADLAQRAGRRLGLGGMQLRLLGLAARLHDIGKLGVPDAILHKPGPLDEL